MSDPKRLVDGDDLGAELLRTARSLDSGLARERKAALMGAAAATSALAAAKMTSTSAKTWGAKALVLKWLAAMAGVAAIGTGAFLLTTKDGPNVVVEAHRFAPAWRARNADAPPNAANTNLIEPILPPVAPDLPQTKSPPAPPVVSIKNPPDRRLKPAPSAAPPSSAEPVAATTLAEELAALRIAREALASGQAPRALRALDEYTARFPRGRLALEAEVLRIEALSRTGDPLAATLARQFLEAHPRSPYAHRLRSLFSETRSNP